MSTEFNLYYLCCIGSFLYLSVTRVDSLHIVNKLAKFMHKPGPDCLLAFIHVLRYLQDHANFGICYYSDTEHSPVQWMLVKLKMDTSHLFFGFSVTLWNDDVDTSKSTGCFLIFYMGGLVDQSSNLPDPVDLSSAEAEYNAFFLFLWQQAT
jgi:hypothetical protein